MEPEPVRSVGGVHPRLDPRFAEYCASRDGDLRDRLIEEHQWLGEHCARRFDHRGEPRDDLRQVAMIGLIKALDRFDPARGFTFATFAVPTIMGELRRHFRDRTWSVRVTRRSKDNYLVVKAVVDELQQVLGRSPSVPELAERAGLDIDDVIEALTVGNAYRGVPLDGSDGGSGGDTCDTWDTDRVLGRDDPGFDACEARVIAPDLVAALPGDRERQIVKLRFVDNMSQSQIAAELGISQVHVSRLLRTSLQLMRRQLTGRPAAIGE